MTNRRAQAALEFLMTYGWAILIMLVVISVLFFLGVFSPQTTVSKSCTLPAGFTCYEFDMDSSGNIYLDLGQAMGKTITITGIGCAPSSPNATLNPNVQIPTGRHAIVTIGGINCSGATNSNFKGKLLIQYTMAGSSGTRSITGDVSAPLIGNSSSWGSGSYSGGTFLYRRQVTINTNVSSDLTDFPAYFILNMNSLISAGKMNNSCKDLRVLDSTMSSLLDYEIENYTCNTTSTVVWFKIPQTHANVTYLAYVFYGNNSSADAQNKAGVWGSGFVSVYHLGNESLDSRTANNGVVYWGSNASGKFGNAVQFNGNASSNRIDLGAGPSFDITSAITISAWVRPDSFLSESTHTTIVTKVVSYYFQVLNDGHLALYPYTYTYAGYSYSNAVLSLGSWQHVAFTYAWGNESIFYNGALDKTTPRNGTILTSAYHAGIGANLDSGGSLYGDPYNRRFNGTIDEVRISNVVRSADWIKAEYGQTYSVGSEQAN